MLFEKYCAVCHPSGGNIINPKKTLYPEDLRVNKIFSAQDIVKVMRNPGPGMPVFDRGTLPDKSALAIAEYIQKTFKVRPSK